MIFGTNWNIFPNRYVFGFVKKILFAFLSFFAKKNIPCFDFIFVLFNGIQIIITVFTVL